MMAVVMLALSLTISNMLSVKIVNGNEIIDRCNGSRSNANILISIPETLCLMAIVMLTISITISELFNIKMFLTTIFRMGHGQK